MELSAIVEKLTASGFTVDANGRLVSEDIAEAVAASGTLETKRAIAPHLPAILDRTEQAYAGTEQQVLVRAVRESYESGQRISVENLLLYDPASGPDPAPNLVSAPALNTAATVLQKLSVPLSIAGQLSPSPVVKALGKAAMPLASGMKSLNKAQKELRRQEKDPVRIARYGVAGVGAVLEALPNPPADGPLRKYVFLPLTTAYKAHMAWQALRMLYRDAVKGDLPPLDELRADMQRQLGRYQAARDRLSPTQQVTRDNLEQKLTHINRFLRHHLHKTSLSDIDIEFSLLGARVASADNAHDTCEFSSRSLPQDDGVFAWQYVHTIFHLDGAKNEGRASLRADRVLEDMAVHDPAYELILQRARLAAVGHAYLAKVMGEATKTLDEEMKRTGKRVDGRTRDRLLRTVVYGELQQQGVGADELRAIWEGAFPKQVKLGLIAIGRPKVESTIDYYKLLREERAL